MLLSKTNFFCACVVGLALIAPAQNAPKSRPREHSSSTKYDQKQSGDYNIQVHLKDFQIIALLGDELSGDYDYNYDYSDLTIKPVVSATTVSSMNNSESSDVDVLKPQTGTEKPSDHPYPIVSPPTTSQAAENSVSTTPKLQPSTNSSGNTSQSTIISPEKKSNSTTAKPIAQSSELPKKPASIQKFQTPQKASKLETEKKTETPVTNISIVPVGKAGLVPNDPHLPLGEIKHYRKCAEGFARDKQGRCRKTRWTPQLPFGLSRFAANLASRFRQATAEKSS